jgi:tryptophan-rich sensory protein
MKLSTSRKCVTTGIHGQLRHNAAMAALAGFIALCFAVAAAGRAVTATSVSTWYAALEKPAFNPPDAVFAPVWTALYLMMAIAAWRVWRVEDAPDRRAALGLWALQLALNLCWSYVFFGARLIGAAALEAAVLFIAVVATLRLFMRVDRAAGWLLAPYAAWAGFAAVLNVALWRLNPAA